MPDITPAQVVAVVGAVIAILVAYGVDLSAAQQDSIMNLVSILAPVLIAGDATVRAARNYRAAKSGEIKPGSAPPPGQG
jgi:hypothetical protein